MEQKKETSSGRPPVIFSFLVLALAVAMLIGEALWLDLYYEEPRRVAVAIGIRESGEWLLPHIYGRPYLKKPPGFSWLIFLFSSPFENIYEWSARAAAIASWLAIGIAVSRLVRHLKYPLARWTAVFASIFSLLFFVEKAALAEIDLAFSLFLLAGLAGWFLFHQSGRRRGAWYLGHFFFLIAFFMKGPVAHLFFYPALVVFFFLSRARPRWRPALISFGLCHALIGGWAVYLARRLTLSRLLTTTAGELIRGEVGGGLRIGGYLLELFTFPLAVWLSFLPFGLIFLSLTSPVIRGRIAGLIRRQQDETAALSRFSLAAVSPFVFFWLYPVHTVRYVMPVFPWLAVLAGITCEKLIETGKARTWFKRFNLYLAFACAALLPALPLRYGLAAANPTALISITLLAALLGVRLYCLTRRTAAGVRDLAGGMILFLLLFKAIYLFLDIPVIRPERLNVHKRLEPTVNWLKRQGANELFYISDHGLETPYYLHREGFRVRITGEEPSSGYIVSPHPPGEDFEETVHFRREYQRDLYIVVKQ